MTTPERQAEAVSILEEPSSQQRPRHFFSRVPTVNAQVRPMEHGGSRTMAKAVKTLALLIVVFAMLTACGNGIPVDPDGSLDRIRQGELRVGVAQNKPWVQLHDDGDPTGTEVDLVIEFAKSLGSEVHWVSGSEEALMTALDQGEIDLVASGLTSKTPWTDKAAITRPYRELDNTRGETEKHVLAVPMGENALLSELEAFLDRSKAGK